MVSTDSTTSRKWNLNWAERAHPTATVVLNFRVSVGAQRGTLCVCSDLCDRRVPAATLIGCTCCELLHGTCVAGIDGIFCCIWRSVSWLEIGYFPGKSYKASVFNYLHKELTDILMSYDWNIFDMLISTSKCFTLLRFSKCIWKIIGIKISSKTILWCGISWVDNSSLTHISNFTLVSRLSRKIAKQKKNEKLNSWKVNEKLENLDYLFWLLIL